MKNIVGALLLSTASPFLSCRPQLPTMASSRAARRSTVAALTITLTLALALAAAATSSGAEQEEVSCQDTLYFRLISMSDYAPGVDASAALALEAAAARNCSAHYVRGVYGRDLGLGAQLYDSQSNYKTAQIIDFESEEAVDAFLACQARQRGAAAASAQRTAAVAALIPAAACAADAPGGGAAAADEGTAAVVDVFVLKARRNDAVTGKRLVSQVRGATDRILLALGARPWAYYDFLDRAAAAGAPAAAVAPEFALVGGSAAFGSVNYLRAYWAYVHGPPSMTSSIDSSPWVQQIVRVQMLALQLKDEATPNLKQLRHAASLANYAPLPLAFSS